VEVIGFHDKSQEIEVFSGEKTGILGARTAAESDTHSPAGGRRGRSDRCNFEPQRRLSGLGKRPEAADSNQYSLSAEESHMSLLVLIDV